MPGARAERIRSHAYYATRMRLRKRVAVPLLLLGVLVLIPARGYLRSASLVARAAGLQEGWPGRVATWDVGSFERRDLEVPSRHGPLRARLYLPRDQAPRRLVVLTSGVHKDGIDEARLVGLARELAESGVTVLTPELPDLLEYRITSRLADLIEDAALWASEEQTLATSRPDGRVGLVGISFSGGLAVVAAGRPALADRVAFVLSFGGHGDLGRTLRYLCTGVQPDQALRPPHDYGVVVILLNAAHLVVPPAQVDLLRQGVRTFLHASSSAMVDWNRARAEFAAAERAQKEMPEPAATLMGYVNTRNVKALGPILLPIVDEYTASAALSPERSPAPRAPVFLLHGADDNVIPAIESTLLGRRLGEQGTSVHHLVTPLITHAELNRQAGPGEAWKMISFWKDILDE
jgi:dienelactone hydrolase